MPIITRGNTLSYIKKKRTLAGKTLRRKVLRSQLLISRAKGSISKRLKYKAV